MRCLVPVFLSVLAVLPSGLLAQTIVSPLNNQSHLPFHKAAIHASDKAYQNGADIYFGRQSYKRYAFCLTVMDEAERVGIENAASFERVPLTRKSIRAFRNSDLLTFVNSVVDCHAPDTLIFRQLEKKDIRNLLYYFEKKYGIRFGR